MTTTYSYGLFNKYDGVEFIGDVIGSYLAEKAVYGKYGGKSFMAFVIGDALYLWWGRNPLLEKFCGSDNKKTADGIYDINNLDMTCMAIDAGGKFLSTYLVKIIYNLTKKGSITKGFGEMLVLNVGADIVSHSARYIQMKIEANKKP